MIKNLPYELRDLEIHMQKLLVRMNAVEAQLKGGSVSPEEFAQLKAEVATLFSEVEAVEGAIAVLGDKQDKEKNISCFATVYTTNTGSSDWIIPHDAASAPTSDWYRRRFNNLVITGIEEAGTPSNPLSSDYFSTYNYGTATAGVRILKPGNYNARAWTKFRRCGYGNASLGIYYGIKPTVACEHDIRCATGSTAAGNNVTWVGETTFKVEPDDVANNNPVIVYLNQWVETKTSNEHFGRFYVPSNSYMQSCGLEIQLISDINE